MTRFVGPSQSRGQGTPTKSTAVSGRILTNDGVNDQWGGALDFVTANTTLGLFNANSQSVNTAITSVAAIAPMGGTITYANNTALPGNLTLNANTGVITGSNTGLTANSYTFDITATESKYNYSVRRTFTILVDQTNGIPLWTTATSVANTTTFAGSNSTIQFAATGLNPLSYNIEDAGTLPAGSTISYDGLLTFATNTISTIGTYTYTFTLRVTDNFTAKFSTRTFTAAIGSFTTPIGQALFTGAYNQDGGQCTYTWTAPTGVTSVSVMAIGGGGGGYYPWAYCGGSGGGSIWANCIPVTPGQSYTVQVGRGGCWNGSYGGNSCFPGILAYGGRCGCCNFGDTGLGWCCTPGAFLGTHCGGFGMVAYNSTAGGGGGAAGYCNGCCGSITPGYVGMGGGGGSATSAHSSTYGSGGGGGTGINGMCCGNGAGACGNAGYSHQSGSGGQGGSGGTCGNPGEPWSNGQGQGYGCGGCYGGGGGGGGTSHGGGWGGPGAVKIIWGTGRCWPNTRTCNE